MNEIQKTAGVFVIGGGGHSKVVMSTLRYSGHVVHSVYDDDPAKWDTTILDCRVVGPVNQLISKDGNGIVAIGDNRTRRELTEFLPHLSWISAIHPEGYLDPSSEIGEGTVLCAGAVAQPQVFIGNHAIVNTATTVDHDCRIGNYVHLAPGVHLGGEIDVCEGTLVGIGATVLPGIRIGRWCTVGAGSVVTEDIQDYCTVVGVPAKTIAIGTAFRSATLYH